MKKLFPAVAVATSALVPLFTPEIHTFMTQHPQVSAGVGALALILSYLTPSPVSKHVQPPATQD